MPWWCWATYMDTKHGHMAESFTGHFATEMECFQWGSRHFACIPGATFRPVFSKSTNRDTARNETRHLIVESGERGEVPEVLNIRFKDLGKGE